MGACTSRPREVNARDASVRSAASEGARAPSNTPVRTPLSAEPRGSCVEPRAASPNVVDGAVLTTPPGRLADSNRGRASAPGAARVRNRPCPLPRVSSHERRPERGLRALFPQPHAADVSSAALSIKRLRRRATPGDALRASRQHQREASLELEDEINFPRPPRHLSATDESGKTPECENPLSPHPLPTSASASESTSTPEPSPRGRRLVLTPSPTGGRLVVEPALSRVE